MRDEKVGCYSHTVSDKGGCSTVVPVPAEAPVALLVQPQRRTQHMSEITWILHPSPCVFPPCNSPLIEATQELTNRKIY